LINLEKISKNINFELGEPFKPFEQLLSVLPSHSHRLLPKAYQSLMLDEKSPIIDFYPLNFEIDNEGSRYSYEGVTLLPFIDEERLLKEVNKIPLKSLNESEIQRNMIENCYLFKYEKKTKAYDFESPTKLFQDLKNCLINVIPVDVVRSHPNFQPILLQNTRLGLNGLESFPSLFLKPISSELDEKAEINIFQMSSKNKSLIIQLDPKQDNRTTAIEYSKILGKKVWIGYPYPRRAIVSSISDLNESIYIENPNGK
jgi:5'-3' exoribonuclease 1